MTSQPITATGCAARASLSRNNRPAERSSLTRSAKLALVPPIRALPSRRPPKVTGERVSTETPIRSARVSTLFKRSKSSWVRSGRLSASRNSSWPRMIPNFEMM